MGLNNLKNLKIIFYLLVIYSNLLSARFTESSSFNRKENSIKNQIYENEKIKPSGGFDNERIGIVSGLSFLIIVTFFIIIKKLSNKKELDEKLLCRLKKDKKGDDAEKKVVEQKDDAEKTNDLVVEEGNRSKENLVVKHKKVEKDRNMEILFDEFDEDINKKKNRDFEKYDENENPIKKREKKKKYKFIEIMDENGKIIKKKMKRKKKKKIKKEDPVYEITKSDKSIEEFLNSLSNQSKNVAENLNNVQMEEENLDKPNENELDYGNQENVEHLVNGSKIIIEVDEDNYMDTFNIKQEELDQIDMNLDLKSQEPEIINRLDNSEIKKVDDFKNISRNSTKKPGLFKFKRKFKAGNKEEDKENRLNSESSNLSKLSAKKVVNKITQRELVQYTNENRSEPSDSDGDYYTQSNNDFYLDDEEDNKDWD
jgi:hypothetical protein